MHIQGQFSISSTVRVDGKLIVGRPDRSITLEGHILEWHFDRVNDRVGGKFDNVRRDGAFTIDGQLIPGRVLELEGELKSLQITTLEHPCTTCP